MLLSFLFILDICNGFYEALFSSCKYKATQNKDWIIQWSTCWDVYHLVVCKAKRCLAWCCSAKIGSHYYHITFRDCTIFLYILTRKQGRLPLCCWILKVGDKSSQDVTPSACIHRTHTHPNTGRVLMKTAPSQRVNITSDLHKHLYPYLYALINNKHCKCTLF